MSISQPSLVAVLVACLCTAAFAGDNQKCSDMSAHQRVLDHGDKFFQEHCGRPARLPRFGIEVPETYTSVNGLSDVSGYSYWCPHSLDLMDPNLIALGSKKDRSAAGTMAEGFETVGDFVSASKLYKRVIEAEKCDVAPNRSSIFLLSRSLNRVQLAQTVQESFRSHKYPEAAAAAAKYLTQIERASEIELQTRFVFVENISNYLRRTAFPKWTKEKPNPFIQVSHQAENLGDSLKRELGCLRMSEQLNQTAGRLEESGYYEKALTLYRDSLSIKQKNLGLNDADTLAQKGDIARVLGESGKIADSKKMYEQLLASFRLMPKPDDRYVIVLEAYGDMLSRNHEQKLADQVYDQAKAFYSSHP